MRKDDKVRDGESPINILIGYLNDPVNIAESLDEDQLIKIGRDAVDGLTSDEESMSDWRDTVDKALKLVKTDLSPKNEPWPNAANFKHPLILDAIISFGDKASSVLLNGPDYVKSIVVGKDEDGSKLKRADRIAEYTNYQLNETMTEWVKEHDRLLYSVAGIGCEFKKTYFSRDKQEIVSEVISYPNFVVNHDIPCIEKMRRFSHLMEFSRNEVIERQRAGTWLDIDLQTTGDDGEVQQIEDDKISTFFEQQTFLDLDDDGYEEPYTIMVHKASSRVLRITPRFDVSGVLVRNEKTDEVINLSDVIANNAVVNVQYDIYGQQIEAEEDEEIQEIKGDYEIIKIDAIRNITKYGFEYNPDGGFLDIGFYHLLAGINGAINVSTNSLLNSGTLANLQGGWMAKTGRQRLGPMKMKPGVYIQTDISAVDLQQSFRDYTFREPSQVLFALTQYLENAGKELASSVDIASAVGANAPAATTLALVQDQEMSIGAIIKRLYRSMAEEFRLIYKLNAEYLDEDLYKRVTDDPAASRADFDIASCDIVPAANPAITSRVQRIQMALAEMSQIEQVQMAGGDIKPIVKSFFEAMGSQNVLQIFPELTPEQQAQQEAAQQEAVRKQQEQIDIGNEVMLRQVEVMEKDLIVKAVKAESEIEERQAKTIKILEEAETEQTKNRIDIYDKANKMDLDHINILRQQVELANALQQPPQPLQQPI